MSVFVCTSERLVRLEREGRSWTSEVALEEEAIQSTPRTASKRR